MSQTTRLIRFLRDHPGSSSLEITLGTAIVNVTGRISDARAAGVIVECRKRADKRQGYWLREQPVQLRLDVAS
jgi:hypothetical protein